MTQPHMPREVILSTKALSRELTVLKLTIESFTLTVMCLNVSIEVFYWVKC